MFEPDVLVVTDASQITHRAIEGPPELVVEISSPTTRRRDRTLKMARYAALGIPHYWLVDPDARRLECYRLENASYTLVVAADGDATLTHPDWPGLTVTLADLLLSPTPMMITAC